MANEAVLKYEYTLPIPMTCADGTGIERGTLLKLTDPFTASAAATNLDIIAGIAAEEKIASDGHITIPVFRAGVFRVTASGSITAGDPLVISGPTANNLVETAPVNAETIIGIAFETASNGETFLMELKPQVMQLA